MKSRLKNLTVELDSIRKKCPHNEWERIGEIPEIRQSRVEGTFIVGDRPPYLAGMGFNDGDIASLNVKCRKCGLERIAKANGICIFCLGDVEVDYKEMDKDVNKYFDYYFHCGERYICSPEHKPWPFIMVAKAHCKQCGKIFVWLGK